MMRLSRVGIVIHSFVVEGSGLNVRTAYGALVVPPTVERC